MTTLRLIARLTDSNGIPLSGKTIYFYYSNNGSTWFPIGSSNTDSSGYASVTYNASDRTWFKAEFSGDAQYDPSSATVVWDPSSDGGHSQCNPLFRVGIDMFDMVLFCVGDKGITVFTVVVAAFFVLLLLRRRRS